jgi:hypothetical protein
VQGVLSNKLPSSIEFQVQIVRKSKEAESEIATILSDYKAERRGPTVTVSVISTEMICIKISQCTRSAYEMNHTIPILREFPSICIPANEQDNRYSALGWEAVAAQNAVERWK